MSPLVGSSKWRIRRGNGELSRSYQFSGLQVPNSTATLTLNCRLERSVEDYFIHSILTLHLKPFRLLHETSFVMGLVTVDQSEGGVVNVRAYPIEGKRDTALLAVENRQDAQKCLNAISSGKEMLFMLGIEPGPYVKLTLPNDGEFQRLYNEAYKRMARALGASKYGPYFERFLRGVDTLVAKTRQRPFGTASKNGRLPLTKTTCLKPATFSLTPLFSHSHKISKMAEWLKARTFMRAVARAHGTSRDDFYLKRGIYALRNAAKSSQRSVGAILKNGSRILNKITLDAFTRLKTATLTLARGYSFPLNISVITERLKARTAARVIARAQDTGDKGFLHDFDALLDAATTKQRSFKVNRDWMVFGASLLTGIVVIVALFGSSSIQSKFDSKTIPNSETSPSGSDLTTASVKVPATASVKIPAETAAYVTEPLASVKNERPNAIDKEPLRQAQSSAPVAIHPMTHAIGDVGILKQNFVGCRDAWQDNGSLQLESKLPANECDVRLPAGTKVIIANVRENNDICVRFPDSVLCYWATGDVLKVSKLAPTTPGGHPVKPSAAKVHPEKAGPVKAHTAIRRQDDDQLKFLFDR